MVSIAANGAVFCIRKGHADDCQSQHRAHNGCKLVCESFVMEYELIRVIRSCEKKLCASLSQHKFAPFVIVFFDGPVFGKKFQNCMHIIYGAYTLDFLNRVQSTPGQIQGRIHVRLILLGCMYVQTISMFHMATTKSKDVSSS